MKKTFKQYLETGHRQYTKEQIQTLPTMNASNIEGVFRIGEVVFDQKRGLGSVPWNAEVVYKGFVAMMKPADFLSFSYPIESSSGERVSNMVEAIEKGFAVGSPFLTLDAVTDFIEQQPYNPNEDLLYKHFYANQDEQARERYVHSRQARLMHISGHEGRARAMALAKVLRDELIPVHFILMKNMRAADLKKHPDVVRSLNNSIAKQGTSSFVVKDRIAGIWLDAKYLTKQQMLVYQGE